MSGTVDQYAIYFFFFFFFQEQHFNFIESELNQLELQIIDVEKHPSSTLNTC